MDLTKEITKKETFVKFYGFSLELAAAMGITYNFADGENMTASSDVFGYRDVEAANRFNQKLITWITASDNGATLNLPQAIWKFKFDSKNTRQSDFYIAFDEKVQAPMMSMKATVPNKKNKTFSLIILPYKNERYQMLVFLPNLGVSTAEIISEISLDNLNNWLDMYTESVLDISFPKLRWNTLAMLTPR